MVGGPGEKLLLVLPLCHCPEDLLNNKGKLFFTILFSNLPQCLKAGRESALFAFLPQHGGMCELDEHCKNDLMQRRITK